MQQAIEVKWQWIVADFFGGSMDIEALPCKGKCSHKQMKRRYDTNFSLYSRTTRNSRGDLRKKILSPTMEVGRVKIKKLIVLYMPVNRITKL